MNDPGAEVLIFADEFGVLIHGPEGVASKAIEQLLGGAAVPEQGRLTLSTAESVAVAASGVAVAAASSDYLRLTAESAAKVNEFGKQFDSAGALRGWVKDGNKFAGQLAFEPVTLGAEQALAIQTAAVSLALKTAIADVQKAVEDVADKVEDVQKHLRARLQGDVIGTYGNLREVVDQTSSRGRLLEADWDSVAGVRNQLHRDIETLRNYVRTEVAGVSLDLSVPDRVEHFERFAQEPGSVADALKLILVTEQSLQLFEFLRLQRVRDTDPEHVQSALKDARSSLQAQLRRDEQLVELMLQAVDRGRVVEVLEVHRVFSKGALDGAARSFHQQVVHFSESSRLTLPGDLDELSQPTFGDARDELKRRAGGASRSARDFASGMAQAGGETARSRGGRVLGSIRRGGSDDE